MDSFWFCFYLKPLKSLRWSWFPFPELTSSSLTSAVTRPLCCTPLNKQTKAIHQHWGKDTKCFCVVTLGLENGLQRSAATPPLSVQTAPCGGVGVQMESKLLPRSDINSLTSTFWWRAIVLRQGATWLMSFIKAWSLCRNSRDTKLFTCYYTVLLLLLLLFIFFFFFVTGRVFRAESNNFLNLFLKKTLGLVRWRWTKSSAMLKTKWYFAFKQHPATELLLSSSFRLTVYFLSTH